MNLNKSVNPHEEIANDLAGIVTERIRTATPVETLSDRGNKLLRLMEENDGSRFVVRSYTQKALEEIEQGADGSFEEAWQGMHEVCRETGIDIVRGHFIRTGDNRYPIILVNEYLGVSQGLETASTQIKARVAGSLGSVLASDTTWVFGSAMMRPDMFGVPAIDGAGAVLQDIDPFVVRRDPVVDDKGKAWYLGKLSRLFWDHWCNPEEREEVFAELVRSVDELAANDVPGEIAEQLEILRSMSNGVDMRDQATS